MTGLNEITLPDMSGGLNTHDPEYGIADNQSPDMLNLWFKDKALCKRPGQALAVPNLQGVHRISEEFNGFRVVHAGSRLYRWDEGGARNYKGNFNASQGYPASTSWMPLVAGDYYIASEPGIVGTENYAAGDRAIYYPSDPQIVTAIVTGSITAAGYARVVVTAKEVTGSQIQFDIQVALADTKEMVASKIRGALASSCVLTAQYTVGGEGDSVRLKQIIPRVYDDSLNISINNYTCAGLTPVNKSSSSVMWHRATKEIQISPQGAGIQDKPGVFVEFGDMLYYIDGVEIWQIDENWNVSPVIPYAPVVMLNCRPDLSESDDNEPYNLLGGRFCLKYNGDASATSYKLPKPEDGLEGGVIEVIVDAVPKTTGYTYDTVAGTVTFGQAPGKGTNNVWITVCAADPGGKRKRKITGCRAAVVFGGESGGLAGGSRVFMTANPEYPAAHWHSDLGLHVGSGMAYFPDTWEEYLDQNGDNITAVAKMGSELVIFKKNSIFALRYAYDGKDAYFPVRECNNNIGCDMPGSVQLIDNKLVFANTKSGVHMLISTGNEREDMVKPLSANVNSLLLRENGLEDACSCDYERYYWLSVNGIVYLWDYEQTPYYNYSDYEQAQRRLAWYRFDNINAKTFCIGNSLYYSFAGGIAQFTSSRNDFGKAFPAYFKSKAFDLGCPQDMKTFMYLYPSFSGDGDILATVTAGSDNAEEYASRVFDIKSFNWDDFSWGSFSWETIKFAKTYSMRLALKKVSYIQIKVSGDAIDRGVGLSGLQITYYKNGKVKR